MKSEARKLLEVEINFLYNEKIKFMHGRFPSTRIVFYVIEQNQLSFKF